MFDCDTMMLKDMERWCVEETVNESIDHGWWTTLKAYAEVLKNQMDHYAEIEYLQNIVNKIRTHPEI